jgi:hypothetical protein
MNDELNEPLAKFLIMLAIDEVLREDFKNDPEEVMARVEFELTDDDKKAIRSKDRPTVRLQLDNIQVMP